MQLHNATFHVFQQSELDVWGSILSVESLYLSPVMTCICHLGWFWLTDTCTVSARILISGLPLCSSLTPDDHICAGVTCTFRWQGHCFISFSFTFAFRAILGSFSCKQHQLKQQASTSWAWFKVRFVVHTLTRTYSQVLSIRPSVPVQSAWNSGLSTQRFFWHKYTVLLLTIQCVFWHHLGFTAVIHLQLCHFSRRYKTMLVQALECF